MSAKAAVSKCEVEVGTPEITGSFVQQLVEVRVTPDGVRWQLQLQPANEPSDLPARANATHQLPGLMLP